MWKKITGYERYSVNEVGEVRNDETGRILKLQEDKDGYLMANLFYNGKRRFIGVHRLVAQAFIPNPNNYPIVNHKDENKHNNTLENLEWCDASYSTNYGSRNYRDGKTKSKKVYQYEDGELVGWYESTKLAGKFLGIKPTHISDCCRGVRKNAGGFIWKYVA